MEIRELQGCLLPWQVRHALSVTVIAGSCNMVMRATRSTRGFAESPTWWWTASPSRPTTTGGNLWWGIQGFHLVWRLWFLPTICNKTPDNYLQWERLNITGSLILKDLICLKYIRAHRTRGTINGVNSSNYHSIKNHLICYLSHMICKMRLKTVGTALVFVTKYPQQLRIKKQMNKWNKNIMHLHRWCSRKKACHATT